MNITQLAKEHGINPVTLSTRLNKCKWSLEKALTTPVKKRRYSKDYIGAVVGDLTIIDTAGQNNRTQSLVLVECNCGYPSCRGQFITTFSDVIGKRSTSCGACRGEMHGMTHTREYKSYRDAKQRCINPNNSGYEYYGGRGIEFRFNSFEEFYNELGPCPDGYTLDRIDNDGHYEIGNVRWADRHTQLNNRREYKNANSAKRKNTKD